MRAVVIARFGGPEVLELRDVARPEPGTGQVLVRVRATALNRADVIQREGRYPAPTGWPQDIPGIEFAGEIAECGPDAREWRVGDRVFGLVGGGAYAEYLVTHERTMARIPDRLSWEEAAAIPEAFITAYDALVTQAGARPSERVLIHAVGSGVGLAAVQLARAVGAVPYGTARHQEKLGAARALGMEEGCVLAEDLGAMATRVSEWTGGRGVDVVLDLVGGPYVRASIDALAVGGRLMLIGTMAGREAELPVGQVMSRRITIRGTTLRARPLEEKIEVTKAFTAQVVPLFARGSLRVPIDGVFPLERAADAHRRLESNLTAGKVVLRVSE